MTRRPLHDLLVVVSAGRSADVREARAAWRELEHALREPWFVAAVHNVRHDPDLLEEVHSLVMQDIFMGKVQGRAITEEMARGLLARIARNKAIDVLRSRTRRYVEPLEPQEEERLIGSDDPEAPGAITQLVVERFEQIVEVAIRLQPSADREALKEGLYSLLLGQPGSPPSLPVHGLEAQRLRKRRSRSRALSLRAHEHVLAETEDPGRPDDVDRSMSRLLAGRSGGPDEDSADPSEKESTPGHNDGGPDRL